MIRYDFPQRSEQWFRVRLGIPTASEFKRIVTPKGWKLSTQAEGYCHRLLAEWMLDAPVLDNPYESEWMQRGSETEALARASYELETGLTVAQVGFVTTDDGVYGCSPDGLVSEDGGLEMKCSSPQVHVRHMLKRDIDDEHLVQVMGCLLVTERKWWDVQAFCSTAALPTVIVRVYRDEAKIAALKSTLDAFVETMLAARLAITREYGQFPRPKPKPADDGLGLDITDEDIDRILEMNRKVDG